MKNFKCTARGKIMAIIPLAYTKDGKEVVIEDKMVLRIWQGDKEMIDCISDKKLVSKLQEMQDVNILLSVSVSINKGYLNEKLYVDKIIV